MGKAQNKGKSLGQIASEVGLYKLCTAGIGTRILMIGTLTGLQVRGPCALAVLLASLSRRISFLFFSSILLSLDLS